MAIFTLEEAARFSGRSPREVRLLIETGEIPGRRRAGRWMVTSHDLERSLSRRGLSDSEPHPPVGADPDDPFAPPKRAEPDRTQDRDARLLERVRRLERELAEVRGELAKADARVIDLERAALEAGRDQSAPTAEREAPTERKASRGRKGQAGRKQPAKGEASSEDGPEGMRQALTPLFRPEGKPPRKSAPRSKPPGKDAG